MLQNKKKCLKYFFQFISYSCIWPHSYSSCNNNILYWLYKFILHSTSWKLVFTEEKNRVHNVGFYIMMNTWLKETVFYIDNFEIITKMFDEWAPYYKFIHKLNCKCKFVWQYLFQVFIKFVLIYLFFRRLIAKLFLRPKKYSLNKFGIIFALIRNVLRKTIILI